MPIPRKLVLCQVAQNNETKVCIKIQKTIDLAPNLADTLSMINEVNQYGVEWKRSEKLCPSCNMPLWYAPRKGFYCGYGLMTCRSIAANNGAETYAELVRAIETEMESANES